jgi:hypothetical protein
MRPRPLTVLLALTAVFAPVGAATGCGGTGGTAPATTAAPALSSIPTVAELARRLQAKGIACQLEYEGLRQDDKTLSLCTIGEGQATLTIWDKPEVLQKFLAADVGAKGATAVGANWTVDVDSPATAKQVAEALGGTVKVPTSSTARR